MRTEAMRLLGALGAERESAGTLPLVPNDRRWAAELSRALGLTRPARLVTIRSLRVVAGQADLAVDLESDDRTLRLDLHLRWTDGGWRLQAVRPEA